jgi:RNA polymerase sigma-70 factor (ECF subfamily)
VSKGIDHALDQYADGIRRRSDVAFRAVYEATADDLASFAYGMLRDRTAAEDAVQQAFLELVRSAEALRGGGEAIRVWLFRSVRFRCLDELRRAFRRSELVSDSVPDQGISDADPFEREIGPGLAAALSALSDRQRSVVVLRHVVGLSGEEIGRVMATNRTAVYAALGRAERALRRALDKGPRP